MAEENTGDFNEEKESAEAEAAAKLEAEKEDNKGEEEKDDEEEEKFDEKEEPPTRKSVQDHIIERKNKKIAKLEKKDEEEETEEEDEGNFTPEDRDAIGKEIEKKTAPLKNALKAQSDKNEMDSLKIKFPEMSKVMEKRIAKYANHKSYQDIPVENIYLMLAGQKSVLQAKKEALKTEDKENQTGGHTFRKGEKGLPDFRKMSGKEFDEYDKSSGSQF